MYLHWPSDRRLTVWIVLGGFPAQANGWRWPIYELIWISGFALVFLALLLPETYEPTILLRRAQRLRKLTGNPNLRSQSEIDAASTTASDRLYEALVRPFTLAAEPALLFSNIYLGFVCQLKNISSSICAIGWPVYRCRLLSLVWGVSVGFYRHISLQLRRERITFPWIYNQWCHGGQSRIIRPYLPHSPRIVLQYTAYCLYQKYYIGPLYVKTGGMVPPEIRLEIGLMASIFIPTSILIFGFTSKADIHWIVPVIGTALYLPGLFLTFQSILMYITMAYPSHAASVLAGNGLFRSAFACCFPQVHLYIHLSYRTLLIPPCSRIFGTAFFKNLGLGPASGLLAGVSFVLIAVYFVSGRIHRLLFLLNVYLCSLSINSDTFWEHVPSLLTLK